MTRHYESLDGLRGVAAVSVLLYHLGHWLNAPWLATNSYLSVDLFFCLSGFVLGSAYWPKRDKLSTLRFFVTREIRLMPLIILGSFVSAAYVVLKNHFAHLGIPANAMAIAYVGALFNFPTFGAPQAIGGPQVFPLNGPQYSLFLEVTANLVWWALRRTPQSAVILVAVALGGVLTAVYGLGGDSDATFWTGFPRVGLSFAIGLGLYMFRDKLSLSAATNAALFAASAAVSLALFFCPVQAPLWGTLLWVLVVSPALVLSGFRLSLTPKIASASLLLGALSYPIYCLQYPIFCWVNGLYRAKFGAQNFASEAPLAFVIVLAGSYAALRLYDEPTRRWLSTAMFRSRPSAVEQAG